MHIWELQRRDGVKDGRLYIMMYRRMADQPSAEQHAWVTLDVPHGA